MHAITINATTYAEAADIYAALAEAFRKLAGTAVAAAERVVASSPDLAAPYGQNAERPADTMTAVSEPEPAKRGRKPRAAAPETAPAAVEPANIETPAAVEPAKVETPAPTIVEPAKIEAPTVEPGTVTIAAVRAAFGAAIAKVGPARCMDFLKGYGIAGIGNLPADKYAEAHAKLLALVNA